MSARRKKKHGGDHEAEHHVDERWAISYMDMVTVLMCLFIVLFAMSTVDAKKYEQLRNSLATGFGVEVSQKVDTAKGVVVPPELVNDQYESFTPVQIQAAQEVNKLEQLKQQVQAALDAAGLSAAAELVIDQRGLTIRLVGAETFFESNSASLATLARDVLSTIVPVLAAVPQQVSVEGNADIRSPGGEWPSNWELSSARATSVVHFLANSGIDAPRLSSVGYGDARPIAAGNDPDSWAQNRRVDIVVVSDAPDAVRSLIPDLLSDPAKLQAALDAGTAAAASTATPAPTGSATPTPHASTGTSH